MILFLNTMVKQVKTQGLIAAPFTPLNKNGSLNTGMITTYYESLEKNKISGVFINGTTGEGASLSQRERYEIAECWTGISRSKKSMRIINLVGGTSYQECIENALHSQETGVDAIALIAPYFFKPAGVTALAEFCARVGEAVPEMPLYFYHFPSLTLVDFPMIDLLKVLPGMLPNFVGIKFTKEDFMDYLSCMNYDKGSYDILWGRDECMLAALVLGARGFVGSTYNYAAPLYQKLIESFNNNDLEDARKLQQNSINMIRLLGKYGGIATGKAFMRYIGIDCGQYRLPVSILSDDMYAKFEEDVKILNMDELFSKSGF